MMRQDVHNLSGVGRVMQRDGTTAIWRSGQAAMHALNDPFNPPSLPLVVTPGASIVVDRIEFDYQGPEISCVVGIGLIPGGLFTSFNNGDNLIATPNQGYGHSPEFVVVAQQNLTHVVVDFTAMSWRPTIATPQIGLNNLRNGSTTTVTDGDTFDAWLWMYQSNRVDITWVPNWFDAVGPDTEFLVLDTDAGVVQVTTGAPSIQVSNFSGHWDYA